MTQEEKDLLFKNLCARLPYGVKCQYHNIQEMITGILIDINRFGRVNIDGHIKDICDVKPYLFPLSSMTEEQKTSHNFLKDSAYANPIKLIDFYNKHHFDWRGLIEKGLAIDATNLNIY